MKRFDKLIYISSIILLVLPVLLFFSGFVRLIFRIPLIILTIYLTYKMICNYSYQKFYISKKYLITAGIILFFWLFFSGIGDFSYQNIDFHFRHAVFRDLVNYNWPVKYNDGFLVYYFSFFLPAALVGKITNYWIGNCFLFLYSYILLFNILYLINRFLKRESKWALIIFILFGGFDIFGIGFFDYLFSLKHIEWWNGLLQYSSNTTLLYWLFNQAIPIWLIVLLIINNNNSKDIAFISTLSFFYCPYATISLIPIALYLFFHYSKYKIKDIFSFNILYAIFVGIVLSLFYISGDGTYMNGFIIIKMLGAYNFLVLYLIFILVEILFYLVVIYKQNKDNFIYKIVLLELLLIPLYNMSPANDFCMRTSIPCLFLLMLYFIKYMEFNSNKNIILLFLLLSFMTSIHEISRSIYYTVTTSKDNYLKDDIVSVGKPKSYKELVIRQFYGSLNSIYYKYIVK